MPDYRQSLAPKGYTYHTNLKYRDETVKVTKILKAEGYSVKTKKVTDYYVYVKKKKS